MAALGLPRKTLYDKMKNTGSSVTTTNSPASWTLRPTGAAGRFTAPGGAG